MGACVVGVVGWLRGRWRARGGGRSWGLGGHLAVPSSEAGRDRVSEARARGGGRGAQDFS